MPVHHQHRVRVFPFEKYLVCSNPSHPKDDTDKAIWHCLDALCGYGLCDECFKCAVFSGKVEIQIVSDTRSANKMHEREFAKEVWATVALAQGEGGSRRE